MNKKLIWITLSMVLLVSCAKSPAVQPTGTTQPTDTSSPPTATSSPTETPIPPTATPEPTETSAPPTATTEPTETSIPGWKKFEGEGIELWLPESYVGGNLSEDVDVIIERLRSLGGDFEQFAQVLEQNPSLYKFWAADSEIGSSGGMTNVSVGSMSVLSVETLETTLDLTVNQLPEQFQVIEREIVSIGAYEAGRLVLEASFPSITVKELMYIIIDDNIAWVFAYATALEEFEERLPSFELSASTIELIH